MQDLNTRISWYGEGGPNSTQESKISLYVMRARAYILRSAGETWKTEAPHPLNRQLNSYKPPVRGTDGAERGTQGLVRGTDCPSYPRKRFQVQRCPYGLNRRGSCRSPKQWPNYRTWACLICVYIHIHLRKYLCNVLNVMMLPFSLLTWYHTVLLKFKGSSPRPMTLPIGLANSHFYLDPRERLTRKIPESTNSWAEECLNWGLLGFSLQSELPGWGHQKGLTLICSDLFQFPRFLPICVFCFLENPDLFRSIAFQENFWEFLIELQFAGLRRTSAIWGGLGSQEVSAQTTTFRKTWVAKSTILRSPALGLSLPKTDGQHSVHPNTASQDDMIILIPHASETHRSFNPTLTSANMLMANTSNLTVSVPLSLTYLLGVSAPKKNITSPPPCRVVYKTSGPILVPHLKGQT